MADVCRHRGRSYRPGAAGQIAEIARDTLRREFRTIDPAMR